MDETTAYKLCHSEDWEPVPQEEGEHKCDQTVHKNKKKDTAQIQSSSRTEEGVILPDFNSFHDGPHHA